MAARIPWWRVRTLAHSPLLRASDRAEAGAVVVAVLLSLGAIPAAVNAGHTVYRDELQVVQSEQAGRRQVLAPATADSTARPGYPNLSTVPIQWATDTGTRDAVVTVNHTVKAQEAVPIWLDITGDMTIPPRGGTDARLAGVVVAIELWALVTAMGIGGVVVVRAVLRGHRYRAWDDEHRRWAF